MRKFKLTMASLALVLTMGAVLAFNEPAEVQTKLWYEYDGSGSQTDPSNFSLAGGTGEEPACEGDNELCAVFAEPSGDINQPDLTTVSPDGRKFKD